MKTLNRIALIATSVCALILPVQAIAEQETVDSIESAFNQGNLKALGALTNNSSGYDSQLASYRLALAYSSNDKMGQAREEMADLIEELKLQIKTNPSNAETLALLASSYGIYIRFDPSKATTFGPLSHEMIARALTLDNRNPRALMVEGTIKYYTPTTYGGSKEKAKEAFKLALKYFPEDQNSGHYWGHAETHVWLGLTLLDLGQKEAAQQQWRKALELQPNHKWAKHLIAANAS